MLLFQKCLAHVPGLRTDVALNGWPADPSLIERADAVVFFCDGGPKHLLLVDDRWKRIDALARRGVGIGMMHYALEAPPGPFEQAMLRWIGAAFEVNWSVNPMWTPDWKPFPEHPILRGVHRFVLRDEWYYHLRLARNQDTVTPLLSAVPPESSLSRPDGPWSGNPAVRSAVARGEVEMTAWACERPDGGRGFGFTGGHFHRNWGNDDERKLVLNAFLWLAKVEVPRDGFASTVSPAELAANLDRKPARP